MTPEKSVIMKTVKWNEGFKTIGEEKRCVKFII